MDIRHHRTCCGICNDSLTSRGTSCRHCCCHLTVLRRKMKWSSGWLYYTYRPVAGVVIPCPRGISPAASFIRTKAGSVRDSLLPRFQTVSRSCASAESSLPLQKLVAAITAPPLKGAVAAGSVSRVARGVPAAQTRRDKLGVMTAAAGARPASETAAGSARCPARGIQNPEEGH